MADSHLDYPLHDVCDITTASSQQIGQQFQSLCPYIVCKVDGGEQPTTLRCRLYWPDPKRNIEPAAMHNTSKIMRSVWFDSTKKALWMKQSNAALAKCTAVEGLDPCPVYEVRLVVEGDLDPNSLELVKYEFVREKYDDLPGVHMDSMAGFTFGTVTVCCDVKSTSVEDSVKALFVNRVSAVSKKLNLHALLPVPSKFVFLAKVFNRDGYRTLYDGCEDAMRRTVEQTRNMDEEDAEDSMEYRRLYAWDMLFPADVAQALDFPARTNPTLFYERLGLIRKEFTRHKNMWIELGCDDERV
jgi:hypothetical protein